MSAIFKGQQSVVLVSDEPYFDAEQGIEYRDQTFAGSKLAIYGLGASLKAINRTYRISHSGGAVYTLTVRLNFSEPAIENLDRYEISTESVEKSIFEFPSVIAAAEIYDGLLTEDGQETFREVCEKGVRTLTQTLPVSPGQDVIYIMNTVIRHLRNGVTGFQFDAILLRRIRRVDLTYAYAGGQINLDEGQTIYSTEQLALPINIGFVVPNTPSDPSDDYSWGWKIRGQRMDIIGSEAEQVFELLFAPWSTLMYDNAIGPLDW